MSWTAIRERVTELFHSSSKTAPRVRNAYEAAGGGRRLRSWLPSSSSPNAGLRDARTLRDRSHQLERDDAYMKKGLSSTTANVVGCGITPRSMASSKAFRLESHALWKRWVKVADANQTTNFYGLLALSDRERRAGGEQFIRKRVRLMSDGLPVPFQIELLAADFCPIEENRDLEGGRKIRCGIEFDGRAKRRVYWMYPSHPADPFQLGSRLNELVPVPASSVIHHYQPLMGGQLRGLPDTIQSLIQTKGFNQYTDAELDRKTKRAAHTGVIRRQAFDEDDYKYDPFTGNLISTDAAGNPVTDFEPGTFLSLLPGEDITLFEGDNTGSGYESFVRQQLLGIAAGLNMPYEVLSGDYKNVNDRILRFIVQEWRRKLEQEQWLLLIPQICERVWEWFIEEAVNSGALSAPGFLEDREDYLAVDWRPHGWPYIHPEQDVNAKIKAIRAGLDSQSNTLAEQGEDAEEIDEQNARDKDRHETLGITYPELEAKATAAPARSNPEDDDNRATANQ